MKNFYFNCCLLLIAFWGFAQTGNSQKNYSQVPAAYRSHPELGKTSYASAANLDYELVHERTQYSRTFLNNNKTKTTVQSSVPLHYADNGKWYSIDYKVRQDNGKITYPVQQPFFEMDGKDASFNIDNQRIKIKKQNDFTFVLNNTVVKKVSSAKQPAILEGDDQIVFKNIAENVDKNITMYSAALKYSYLMNTPGLLPQQFDYLLVEESMTLPKGFSIREEKTADTTTGLTIINQKGEAAITFHQAVLTDSKVLERGLRQQPYEANYQLIKHSETTYTIQIKIDSSWLQSTERVYPINIDPVVTVNSNTVVNSCFSPTYSATTLVANIPAGESVLNTDINYDFIAVTGSSTWMSDLRTIVAGPNGVTPTVDGVGNTPGLYTGSIANSDIGNVVSTGQINYVFSFARTFGGNGCNATYAFSNRREVVVTYGTITFGNGPLMINEYSAANRNFNDSFGRNEDWVELYNASPTDYVNLAGYYLSNNINNPTKWQIQSGVVPPNSRLLVFCSERNIATGPALHASFDLTQTDGDEIVLSDPTGAVLESHTLFINQTNHSYGRTTDGASTWSVFTTPTPASTNTGGSAGYTTKPTFNIAPGKYPGPISVTLATTGSNEQIRYTTNGATPSATSTLYTGPISLNATTVIRARTFSTIAGIQPGFIETNSYLINDNSTLPVVSLAGDANLQQLLGGTQIEPTGYFEYFKSDGTFIDETMGDFDKHGNDSWAYAQRGIDFIARDDHGYKRRLEHQFFSTSQRTTYRRLILKAAGSDNYPHQTGGAHFRDVFVQKVSEMSHMDLDERRSTFVSLFVNGQYWGVYDLREKVDDNHYTDFYYGQDYLFRDSDQYLQYMKTWGTTYPEFGNQPAADAWTALTTYVQNNNMAVQANYEYIDSQLNINSLIDYFVINSFMVNRDWLNWNTSWWRGTDPTGTALKWRYALWDMDGTLGHYTNYTGIPNTSATAPPCQAESINVGVGHAQTIEKLITESPIVKQRYITRYADLLNTGLKCERLTQIFDSIVAVITPEMPRQIARWGGSMATWQANVQAARTFLMTRCSQTISSGLVSCYNVTGPFETTFQVSPVNTGKIKMNSEWLATYPFSAQVFGNIETQLKAEANTNYEFSHWVVDGAVILPDASNPDIILQISQATSVTAHFTEIITGDPEAIHYWHFNTLVTPVDVTTIAADHSSISGATPMMTYTGTGPRDIDANNSGSIINLHFDAPSGKSARVRNPSDGRSLVFDVPTTGYQLITFDYAVQRTAEGQLTNHVFYTLDGVNYTQDALLQSWFSLTTDFGLASVDFSHIPGVNNNPNFKVKLTFVGNTTAANGNNRFDNVTLKGFPIGLSVPSQNLTTYQVFPNPFTNSIQIINSEPMNELSVYDMVGKRVWQKTGLDTTTHSIDLPSLNVGVYVLKIKTESGVVTHKLVKK